MPVMRAALWLSVFLLAFQPAFLSALTQPEVLQILGEQVLRPSLDIEEVRVLLVPAPLTSGVVEPYFAPPSIDVAAISGNPQWFAFVDLHACMLFQHEVLYVFIDDTTGAVVSHAANDWPLIDGAALEDGAGPGQKLVRIYPLVPGPRAFADDPDPLAPAADYGDAPDGGEAYSGIPGRFPTLYATTHSVLGRPGAHALAAGQEMLGDAVSIETDAVDPSDPDGRTNLDDGDSDERMFLVYDPNTSPATGRLIFDVTVTAGAPPGARYLNVLFDFDTDGAWGGAVAGTEWAVVNQALTVAPASTDTVLSDAFPWGDTDNDPEHVWMRAGLTRTEIASAPFGSAGWDGSGAFAYGEVEDFEVCRSACPSGGCKPGPSPDEGSPPGPDEDCYDEPITDHALVVQGADRPGESIVARAAAAMLRTLHVQGYNAPQHLSGTAATADEIGTWISGTAAGLACSDRVFIYIIAHGLPDSPGGAIVLQNVKEGGLYTGAELHADLSNIPPCQVPHTPNNDCRQPHTSCFVSVLIESCFSGQFMDSLPADGREIITTSASNQPSYISRDGPGGEYSELYAKYADSDYKDLADGNDDGVVTPGELHAVLAGEVTRQTPQYDNRLCVCACTTGDLVRDCLYSLENSIVFYPGYWLLGTSLVGVSFYSGPFGVAFAPGSSPMCDYKHLLDLPDKWNWRADVHGTYAQISLEVTVTGFNAAVPLTVALFEWIGGAVPPLPLQLNIDLTGGTYELLDNGGTPLQAPAAWSGYPGNLDTGKFLPIAASRATERQTEPLMVEIRPMDLVGRREIKLQWGPLPGTTYYVDHLMRITDTPWQEYYGPASNTVLFLAPASDTGSFRVRAVAP